MLNFLEWKGFIEEIRLFFVAWMYDDIFNPVFRRCNYLQFWLENLCLFYSFYFGWFFIGVLLIRVNDLLIMVWCNCSTGRRTEVSFTESSTSWILCNSALDVFNIMVNFSVFYCNLFYFSNWQCISGFAFATSLKFLSFSIIKSLWDIRHHLDSLFNMFHLLNLHLFLHVLHRQVFLLYIVFLRLDLRQ